MEKYRFTDGTSIQGNRSPSLHECQRIESWNPEKVDRKRNHTLQCGCFEHRALILNHSLSKSAQYQRSSLKLEWTALSKSARDWAKLGKVHSKRRLREPRYTEERDFTGGELFGRFFKVRTCVWKQVVRESSELRVTVQNRSICESMRASMRASIILAPGGS